MYGNTLVMFPFDVPRLLTGPPGTSHEDMVVVVGLKFSVAQYNEEVSAVM